MANSARMYLRFVFGKRVDGMGAREGLFQATRELVEDPQTEASVAARLATLTAWFSNELDAPVRFTKSKSKGHYRRDTKGLSWFKPTATEHIAKAFELKAILDTHGYGIDVL